MANLRAVVLLLAACGGGSPSGPSPDLLGPPDQGVADLRAPDDLTSSGFTCGSMTCSGGAVCCVTGMTPSCQTSCPDGGFVAQCMGPDHCGGNPCCITIANGFVIHDVSCTTQKTDCPPNVNTNGSGKDRACRTAADCTDGVQNPSLPDCCTNTSTNQKVCFSKGLLLFIPGFTCP